jgi:hypothetical protein
MLKTLLPKDSTFLPLCEPGSIPLVLLSERGHFVLWPHYLQPVRRSFPPIAIQHLLHDLRNIASAAKLLPNVLCYTAEHVYGLACANCSGRQVPPLPAREALECKMFEMRWMGRELEKCRCGCKPVTGFPESLRQSTLRRNETLDIEANPLAWSSQCCEQIIEGLVDFGISILIGKWPAVVAAANALAGADQ